MKRVRLKVVEEESGAYSLSALDESGSRGEDGESSDDEGEGAG